MLKIGIFSFSEKSHSDIVDMVDHHKGCQITGVVRFDKVVMVDDKNKDIDSSEKLIEKSDLLVLESVTSEHMDLITKILRKSKHVYLIHVRKLTQNDTNELVKLSNEAGTFLVINQNHRIDPVFYKAKEFIQNISFINIIENGVHEGEDALVYHKLMEKVDLLLMFMNSNIYRVTTCSSSDEFVHIIMEFNNSVTANITINQLADTNVSCIEILSPGENIKIDLLKREIYKINKSERNRLFEDNHGLLKNKADRLYEEFSMIVNAILCDGNLSYDITNYHFANIITEEVLKKISYVLT